MPIDYKRYPPNWSTDLVPLVLKRAGNKCECCELENKSTVFSIKMKLQDSDGRYKYKAIWFRDRRDAERELQYGEISEVCVVLTVAHLDHDEHNWNVDLKRLKAMCQLCHLRYDAKEKWRRSLVKTGVK